jgi:outer membrane protein assembly factor BamD (BamD/ComL family)
MRSILSLLVLSALSLVGCNRLSPEELWLKAEEARGRRNYDLAAEHYTAILNDHPQSQYAESAAMMIATMYNNESREFAKAVDAYKVYVARFPDSGQAPIARFMVGFLYHNELKQLDSAAVWFRSFLDRHPDHEMAPSARFELENLGRSPDELVPADTTAPAHARSARTPAAL